jgi:glycosyltransferase involved in cell wall biosynthesis
MSEKVTWLLPIKNGMPYLSETLASIEAQTYRSWEVLAWDNGSTDGTVEELRKWIPSRLPGQIFTGTPLSLGSSRARLVEIAGTELCACIDADDINLPERLERQVAFMLTNPQVGIVGAQVEFIDEKGQTFPGAWVQPTDDAEIRWQLRWQTPFNHPTVMYRRSVVLDAGNYSDFLVEDYDLWFRIGLIAETANLPQVLLKYRRLSTSYTAACSTLTGTTSPLPLFEMVAERNADKLFTGMSAEHAIEFRRKMLDQADGKIQLQDLIALRNAARLAARDFGKGDSYFRSTELYRAQRTNLMRRWISQHAWGRTLLTAKRKVQSHLKAS